MKNIKLIISGFFVLQIAVLLIIVGTAKFQDVTLATGKVKSLNAGWSRITDAGSSLNIEMLPYFGESSKDETVIFSNIVPEDMCGKTLSFLSADKTVEIFVDDCLVYSFGNDEEKKIGRTPGSVMVFADIPETSAGKNILIVGKSPYKNYASYMTEMVYGDRDVIVLHFIKNKIPAFLCCFGIFVCGIVILIFGITQKLSRQDGTALISMGIYLLVMLLYHMIETKLPMILYGNQFLYSNLIFLSLMSAPLLWEFFLFTEADYYRKPMMLLMAVTSCNILIQLILQCLNIKDFLEMAFVSHGILLLNVIVGLTIEIRRLTKTKQVNIAFVVSLILAICIVMDLARNMAVKVGDLGRYSRIGILFLGIAVIVFHLKDNIRRQINYAENEKTEAFSSEIINTLVAAIDAKDIYTRGHSTRVADYSVRLAKALGWNEDSIKDVRYKALLHDVGKIGIPDRVLNKADRLTDDEYEIIKSHTTMGANILSRVSSLSDMGVVAKYHHERYDGKGYPEHIKGDDIPKEARLVGICDSYDAMASDRAYRKALPKESIRAELIKGKGTQFDPEMTDSFVRLFDEGQLESNSSYEQAEELKPADVISIINTLTKDKETSGATKLRIDDVKEIYRYIDGIQTRYGIGHNIIVISLFWEDSVTMDELATAMKAMDYSIRQSLRKVDVMANISQSQYLLILTETDEKNIQMILDRIFNSFYSNSQNLKIKPEYEVY